MNTFNQPGNTRNPDRDVPVDLNPDVDPASTEAVVRRIDVDAMTTNEQINYHCHGEVPARMQPPKAPERPARVYPVDVLCHGADPANLSAADFRDYERDSAIDRSEAA